jgi:bifunctional DNA-binding transcriptional regulator/antitoxin component of YhaV-PrlF toxin-antitoxin module
MLVTIALLDMSESTRVTDKEQATITSYLRDRYDVELGDEIIWIDIEGGIEKRTWSRAVVEYFFTMTLFKRSNKKSLMN